MTVVITDLIDDDHLSHYWYGGHCAKIKHKGYTAHIEALGDVCVEYAPHGKYLTHLKDKSNSGMFYHEIGYYLHNDKDLYAALKNGDLRIDNNNWWECFITDKDGNEYDLMWCLDSDYLTDAIEEVKEQLDDMIKYIEEELK